MTHAKAETLSSDKLGTREKIIRTAVKLIAQQGPDGVSLNEIVRQAGQRNASALQYHFGGKSGLIQAIFDHFRPAIETRRQQMLEDILNNLQGEALSMNDVASLVVLPFAEQLDNEQGGRDYLRFAASMHNHVLDPNRQEDGKGIDALRSILTDRSGGMPEHIVTSRRAIGKTLLLYGLSDYCRLCENDPDYDKRQRPDLIATLTAAFCSILTAPSQTS